MADHYLPQLLVASFSEFTLSGYFFSITYSGTKRNA